MSRGNERRTVEAVQTTCDILGALHETDGAGVTEIAERVGCSKGTVHSHLTTLRQNEYVVKEDDVYRTSLRFLDLAEAVRNRLRINAIVQDELEDLAEETGEIAQFAVEEHGQAIYLHKARGEKAVQTASRVGTREYLHSISLGKAIMAHLPRARVEEIIERHGLPEQTANSITDPAQLHDELQEIRERGYALDNEERIKGLRCVAAPVKDSDEGVIGAVSVSGPSTRIEGDRFRDELPKQVTRAANVLEINVQYS